MPAAPDACALARSQNVPTEVTATVDATDRRQPFQIRGAIQTILVLRLVAPEDPEFFERLKQKVAYAPDFYRDAPILLDVAPIAGRQPIDLADLVDELRRMRLWPVGLQNADLAWQEAARAAGLAVFAEGGQQTAAPSTPGTGAGAGPRTVSGAALRIDRPIRGGQQIVAREGDLVVTAPVGHGAEIAAAGHIHVYAPLRGRAYAGIDGDETAMIFCDRFEAELVAIAGTYLVAEELDRSVLGRRVRVRHDGHGLVIEPVG